MDTSDLSSGRPDSPDSVKSEVSCSSGKGSVGEGSRPKATGATKTPLRCEYQERIVPVCVLVFLGIGNK